MTQQKPTPQAPATLSDRSLKTEDKFTGVSTHQDQELASIAVATKERALIEGAFIMAKKFPRSEEDARAKILKTCSIYSFAEKAKYKKPVGNTFIIGPSIRLAEEMARQWGNLRIDATILYDDPQRRLIQAFALDLETGTSGSMQFTIEKTVERKNATGRVVLAERTNSQGEKVSIVVATEDETMTKQNATLSKYRRNLILQLMPTDILQDSLVKIDATLKAGVAANPEAAKKAVMDNFAKFGVMPTEIEKYLAHPIVQMTPDEIIELKEVFTTLSEGEDTWKNILAAKTGEGKVVQEAPSTASFKPGDEKTHTAVDAPVIDAERSKLLQEIEALRKEKGEKAFQAVLGKTGFKELEKVPTGILKEIHAELNWN